MIHHIKPIVVVSKCLGFDNCRYNGQMITDKFIEKLRSFVEFQTVCPEMEIGLGVPREPIRVVEADGHRHLFQPATESDFTDKMQKFSEKYLSSLQEVDGFILKNRSPSCGILDVKIFQGFDKSSRSTRGSGFFGSRVLDQFAGMPIEDEGRLKNFAIREHFLTKLYTFTRFRIMKKTKRMKDLVIFHTRHKYLFLGYNQSRYRNMGPIVANHEKHDFDQVINFYEAELKQLFHSAPKDTSMINALQHLFGYISDGLSKPEKSFFLSSIEEYRDERIPLSTLIHMIYSYAVRFNQDYLLNQMILNPYPKELVEITDSGKGRNY